MNTFGQAAQNILGQQMQQSPPLMQTFGGTAPAFNNAPRPTSLQQQSYDAGAAYNAPPNGGHTTTVTTTSAAAEQILGAHRMDVDRPNYQFPPIGEGMLLYMCSKCKCRSHAQFARNWKEVKSPRTGKVLYSPGILLCYKCAEVNINVHELVARSGSELKTVWK